MTDSCYLISNQNNSRCTIVFGHEFEGDRMCARATWVKRKIVRVVGWALDFHRNSYEVKRSRVAVWAAHSQSSPKNSNKRLSEKGIGWMGEQGTLKLQRKRKKERKLRPWRKKFFFEFSLVNFFYLDVSERVSRFLSRRNSTYTFIFFYKKLVYKKLVL